METIILCGGLGTRLSEETDAIPKPMVKINGTPILENVMRCYLKFGFEKFILAAGYKSEIIKQYFLNYEIKNADVIIDKRNKVTKIKKKIQNTWSVKIIDTGVNAQTGARIKYIKKFLDKENENFFMTYGDGIGNIDIKKLLAFHLKHKKIATMTIVRPQARFGHIKIKGNSIIKFKEKDRLSEGWINGGFFVLNKKIFKYINNKQNCIFEKEPLEFLAKKKQLMAYKHNGFWHPMDTLRDKRNIELLGKKGIPPWLK